MMFSYLKLDPGPLDKGVLQHRLEEVDELLEKVLMVYSAPEKSSAGWHKWDHMQSRKPISAVVHR
jgi:hypothetical protein